MTSILFDAPGPQGRRRTLIGSIIGAVFLLAVIASIVIRLEDSGQFRSVFWEPFTDAGIQRGLLRALGATLKAAGISIVFALLLGSVLAVGRLSERAAVRWAATGVVEFFRAMPLVLLIFFARFGLPELGIDVDVLWYLVFALSLYNGAVLAEILRAGILSVPRGQSEAAYAIGLRKSQVMRIVLLPQAIRTMLPTLISQLVVLNKDTALGYIIAYPELLRRGKLIADNFGNIIPMAIVVGSVYILINLSLSTLASYIEGRQRRRGVAPPVDNIALSEAA
ncbi:MAG: amino acid ABC transporter permease [Acidimicrobiales bacterium]